MGRMYVFLYLEMFNLWMSGISTGTITLSQLLTNNLPIDNSLDRTNVIFIVATS